MNRGMKSDRELVFEALKNTYRKEEEVEEDEEDDEEEEVLQSTQYDIPYFTILSVVCFLLAILFLFIGRKKGR